MRRILLASLSLALFTACPDPVDPGVDAGADAGPVDDGGTQTEDAGGGEDAGSPDGGEPSECGIPDPCADVAAVIAIEMTAGATPALVVGGSTFTVGASTRADVEAALGAGTSSAGNPFRVVYCPERVALQYVDDVGGNGAFEGTASGGDLLARVITLEHAAVTTSVGISIGEAAGSATAKLQAPVTHAFEGGSLVVSPAEGLSFLTGNEGTVASVQLFLPQAEDRWGLEIALAEGRIGSGDTEVRIGATSGTTLNQVGTRLGTAYDAQGYSVVSGNTRALGRLYSSYGIRLVAICSNIIPCNNDRRVVTILLSPPFVGAAPNGVRIGASEATIVGTLGEGTPNASDPNLVSYATGGERLGVLYVEDSACVRRAAALILGYREAP